MKNTSVIYVLKLQNDKYYVGRSKNHEQRIQQHVTGNGSEWTRKYSPLQQEPVELLEDEGFMELSTTLKYMKKYGVDNVRGADYSTLKLSSAQKAEIQQHFRSEDNLCFKCGGEHFIRQCDVTKSETGWFKLFCAKCFTCFVCCFSMCSRKPKQPSKCVKFGKYSGKTYEEVLKKYPDYCSWIVNNTHPPFSPNVQEFRDWCLVQSR